MFNRTNYSVLNIMGLAWAALVVALFYKYRLELVFYFELDHHLPYDSFPVPLRMMMGLVVIVPFIIRMTYKDIRSGKNNYGAGLQERKLIWIKPTLVGLKDKEAPPVKDYEIR